MIKYYGNKLTSYSFIRNVFFNWISFKGYRQINSWIWTVNNRQREKFGLRPEFLLLLYHPLSRPRSYKDNIQRRVSFSSSENIPRVGLTRFRHLSNSANRIDISNIEKRGLSPVSNLITQVTWKQNNASKVSWITWKKINVWRILSQAVRSTLEGSH